MSWRTVASTPTAYYTSLREAGMDPADAADQVAYSYGVHWRREESYLATLADAEARFQCERKSEKEK